MSTNFRHNEQIRISPVRLVNDKEEQVGIVSTAEALRMAREAGMDLVEVAPTARPPVCRIMDYGKWRYQQQKKEDKSRASSRGGRLKQLNIDTIRIGDNDLHIKMERARGFLKEGNKVQFTLRFKGREMAHQNLGRDLMNKVKQELWQVSKVERDAKMEGRRMTLVLQPDHKAPGAKPPAPAAPTPAAIGNFPERRGGPVAPSPMTAGSGLNLPSRPGAAGPGVPPRPAAAGPGGFQRPGGIGPGGPPRPGGPSRPMGPRMSPNPVANLPVAGPRVSPNPVANLPVAGRAPASPPPEGAAGQDPGQGGKAAPENAPAARPSPAPATP